jgi:hypothetical protein
MNIPEGDPKHCSLCFMRAQLGKEFTEAEKAVHTENRPLTRDEKIDWALGNLNASTNHKTTREAVAAAYDRLHPEG